ncbi:MAG: phosphate ABC transporter substrate-binding protein [Verrucomicrobia bacterium]|nr:phosphate ABC transporter substrate-binding protein [Verrucomicrobiota bacterium]MDA1087800.1 phosphate ABC transporter substrate-binding protein [Verrucomicrobiota bacterium]
MSNRLTRGAVLGRRFGYDEHGFVDLPARLGGTKISRVFAESRGECGFCFPHGPETSNATIKSRLRSWKRHRKHQYVRTVSMML